MRLTLPFVVLAAVAVGSAWEMVLSYDDTTKLTLHGHTNSHCQRFKKRSARIDNVFFKGSTFADTFELYSDNRCRNLVFKGKKGSNPVPGRIYGSYKVY